MIPLLEELARINLSGAPFLVAYGATWLICGYLWKTLSPKMASLATLFQGTVALPIALIILYFIDAFAKRPETSDLDGLVILIAMSQLLALPLLIIQFHKKHYSLIPVVFTLVGAVHFLMYTWLYQTAAYIVMSIAIVLAISFIYYRHSDEEEFTTEGAAKVCSITGALLLLNAICLTVIQFI